LIALTIGNAEIEQVLSFLHSDYSNVLAKVWESGDMTNAVFVQTEMAYRTVTEQTITIVMQYHTETHSCDLTAVASGGGSGLLRISLGSQDAAESTFLERIMNLARSHDWDLSRKHPGFAGSRCPYCGAYYLYDQSQVSEDGSVRCQNCDKSFLFAEAQKAPEARTEKLT